VGHGGGAAGRAGTDGKRITLETTGLKTKRAVIEEALRTLVQLRAQERVRALRGKLQWEGDLEVLREGRFEDEAHLGLDAIH